MTITSRWRPLLIATGALLAISGSATAQSPLLNGENQHAAIATPMEVDHWTFIANAGDRITLTATETPRIPDTGFVPWVRLYAPNGAAIASGYGALVGHVSVTATVSGTYGVEVLSADQVGNAVVSQAVGDYTLRLAQIPAPFTVPAGDDGGQLTNGTNHAGRIDVGDLDLWTFTASQGDAVTMTVAEVPVGPSVPDPGFAPWIEVYGPTGLQVGAGYGPLVGHTSFRAPLTGTYTALISSADQAGNTFMRQRAGDYILRLAKSPGAFSTSPGDHGGPISNGINHVGRIEMGDLDMWSFDANQGDAVMMSVAEIPVSPTTVDPGFVPWLEVYGPTGVQLGAGYGALVGHTDFRAPLTGTYTAVISSADQVANGFMRARAGDYILRLAKVPGAFGISGGDQGGPATLGVTHPGRIESGDFDLWTVAVARGATITATVSETPVPPTTPDPGFVPWIRLLDPNGIELDTVRGDPQATVHATAPLTGTYTVVINSADMRSNNLLSEAAGDYTVHITAVPPPPTSVDDPDYVTPFDSPLVIAAPGVLANDLNATTATLSSTVTRGVLSLNANGSFVYTPPSGFTGVAFFSYRAVNATGSGNVATVMITVQAPGAPVAADDLTYSTPANTMLVIASPGVLGNDVSPSGSALSAVLQSVTTNGVLALNTDGSFAYTPNSGFSGADSFSYRASNANGTSNVATVRIQVGATTVVQSPVGLFAHTVAGNLVTLRWTPPATGPTPTSYVMEGGVAPGQTLAAIPTGSANPVFTFAAPNGAFHLRVRTIAGAQTSAVSNEIRVFVNQPVAPSAPANLLGLVNGAAVALSWRPTFSGGAANTFILDVSGTLSASLPLGLTETFNFNGVPGGTYTFTVRAANGSGSSAASNPVTLNFPSVCSGVPAPPASFLAYNVGNTLNLMWEPPASGAAATSYVLNVTGSFNGALPFATRGLSTPVPPGSYTFSVSAMNACGASASTTTQTVVVP
jgi:hypothetical protein